MRNFNQPINQILDISNSLQSALAGAERVFEVMDEEFEKDKDLVLLGGQIAEFAPQIMRFNKDGYGIFLAEYRGYGNSGGKINQDKTIGIIICKQDKGRIGTCTAFPSFTSKRMRQRAQAYESQIHYRRI